MSVTLDANVLLYASDAGSPRRDPAAELLGRLAEGPDLLYLFWPVLVGYVRIATHPGVFADPLSPEEARRNVQQLLTRPHVRSPGEQAGFWQRFDALCAAARPVRGNLVSDAHVAALMRQHGVVTIYTADRDFRRFDGITAVDPFT